MIVSSVSSLDLSSFNLALDDTHSDVADVKLDLLEQFFQPHREHFSFDIAPSKTGHFRESIAFLLAAHDH